jgi:hypothetical protein
MQRTTSPAETPMNFDFFLDRLREPISENHIQGMVLSGLISTIFTLNPANVAVSVGLSFLASRIDLTVRPVLDRYIPQLFDFDVNRAFTNVITILFVMTVTIGISSTASGVLGSAFVVDKLITYLMTLLCSTKERPLHVFC